MHIDRIDVYVKITTDRAQRGVPTEHIVQSLMNEGLDKHEIRLILVAASLLLHDREVGVMSR